MKQYYSLLSSFAFFQDIKKKDMEQMLNCIGSFIQTYPKNTLLFSSFDILNSIGIVLEGSIQIIYDDSFGNHSILAEVTQGSLFGEAFVCAGKNILPISIQCSAKSTILFLPYKKMITASYACHNQLIENMVQILANKNILLNQKVRYLSKRTTKEKLLSYLSDLAYQTGSKTITIAFNRQELADFLCVERSAMSTALGKLKAEGIIDFHKNTFRLLS